MKIEKTALLPVTADEAFALITEPERLRRWLAVSARVDLRAGGEFRWTLTPMAVAAGTVLEVEPGRRLVLAFAFEAGQARTDTVIITIEPVQDGTLVRLVHDGLPDDQGDGVLEGWTHFLERLERAAVTGDAGPDEWAAAPAELTPITSAHATLAVLQDVLHGLDEADLGAATPCSDFTVAQLEKHLLGSITSLGGLSGRAVEPGPGGGSIESRIAEPAAQAVEGWMARGTAGVVQAGPQELPAELAVGILSIEFLVHAWDFARATGRKVTVSDEVATYVLGLAERIIDPRLRESAGFAPALPSSEGSPPLDRLLAFTGRSV